MSRYVVMALGESRFTKITQGDQTMVEAKASMDSTIASETQRANSSVVGYLIVSYDGTTYSYNKNGAFQGTLSLKG